MKSAMKIDTHLATDSIVADKEDRISLPRVSSKFRIENEKQQHISPISDIINSSYSVCKQEDTSPILISNNDC